MGVGENILKSTQILIDDALSKASFDRTIQAEILSCKDESIGKYKCKYQDSYFYAYTDNPELTYSDGSYVYILVPGNDFSNVKVIIGAATQLGANYITEVSDSDRYDIVGTNIITSLQDKYYYLDTQNIDYSYQLYNAESINNKLEVDSQGLKEYLKNCDYIIAGATFRTEIPASRQYKGHYGIIFNLRFKNETDNSTFIKPCVIDEDVMKDDPYRLSFETRQVEIFSVKGLMFDRIESVVIFNKNFPGATGTETGFLTSGDIIINNIQLSSAQEIATVDLEGFGISFLTPQGTLFKADALQGDSKQIIAQLKIRGKIYTLNDIDYFWGREDVGITNQSKEYCNYLGRGWKCLNDYNKINEDDVVEWAGGKNTFVMKLEDATAANNRLKVAALYDGKVISKEINIRNLSTAIPTISIVSDKGTSFSSISEQHINLTCLVNGQEINNYTYHWSVENYNGGVGDSTGSSQSLEQTTEENQKYEDAWEGLQALFEEWRNYSAFPELTQQQKEDYQAELVRQQSIRRVSGNKLINVQVNKIAQFAVFKCSVYNDSNKFLGTASITINNTLDIDEVKYTVNINNSSVSFKYNQNGIAPNVKSTQNPQVILPLSFVLYENGKEIDEKTVRNINKYRVTWAIPNKNTLIVDENNGIPTSVDDNYNYYENIYNLYYDINSRFSNRKANDQIKLKIQAKKDTGNWITLTEDTTNFTFVKDGDPGTNGTEYVVKLMPNTTMDNPPRFPVVTTIENETQHLLNYGLNNNNKQTRVNLTTMPQELLKVQFYKDGELVTDNYTTKWQILANKYGSQIQDESAFQIVEDTKIKYNGDYLVEDISTPKANIIKCTIIYNEKEFFGTVPITTAWISSNDYRVALKENGGFRYVVYNSEGILPQYDESAPFEVICKQKINNIWVDISRAEEEHSLTYSPDVCGDTLKKVKVSQYQWSYSREPSNQLKLLNGESYRSNLEKNQFRCSPVSSYTGKCINNTIYWEIQQNNQVVMRIAAPIHFLLNRFSFPAINGWDGNSIEINENQGYLISPKIGAGSKDANNSFTGVLMGTVQEPGKQNQDIGLLGFSHGTRSFFLDSQTGAAIFGTSGNGRIIVDPNENKALIYSDGFWKNYSQNGLPINYSSSNEYKDQHNVGRGMLIDLTTPEIRWGNGNFKVSSDGILDCSGATIRGSIYANNGEIGGWKISRNGLSTSSSKGSLSMTIQGGYFTSNEDKTRFSQLSEGRLYIYTDKHEEGQSQQPESLCELTPDQLRFEDRDSGMWGTFSSGGLTMDQGNIQLFDGAIDAGGKIRAGYFTTSGSISGASLGVSGAISGASLGVSGAISGASLTTSGVINSGSNVRLPNATFYQGKLTNGSNINLIGVSSSNNIVIGNETYSSAVNSYGSQINLCSNNGIRFYVNHNETDSLGIAISEAGNIRPIINQGGYCGTSGGKWVAVYAKNTTIQTSDKKEKDNIESLSFSKNLLMNLQPITYMWKTGDHRRKRMGFIAQDVADICKNIGENLSLVTASYKEQSENKEYFGEQVDDNLLTWGMSYEQLIAPMVAMIQQHQILIQQLKQENALLKEKLS